MKNISDKEEWRKFREEILELVMLYSQINEFSIFDQAKIEYIPSFFIFSRNNAIAAFYIKFGFLITDGQPTFRNFLEKKDYDELALLYREKIGIIRDKFYAHNVKSDKNLKSIDLTNKDIDDLYKLLINFSKKIDAKYNETFCYDSVHGAEGILSIDSIIQDSIELERLKEQLASNGYQATVRINLETWKIEVDPV